MRFLSLLSLYLVVVLLGTSLAAISFTDSGFEVTTIASNLNPTQLAALPDGRILVLEKQGLVRVVKNDVMLAVSFNISDLVNDYDERGLLGVIADPDFANNGYIYLYYTHEGANLNNRVSRFTMTGDVLDAASETLIFELDPLGTAGNHNGGGISFGADGKLYIATGENTISSNAQSTASLLGKIHRINKDGTIPTDNPMYNTLTGKYRAIYAIGVRNPWTLNGASSGEVLFFDVGYATYEEVNVASAGANYGWPNYEGYTVASTLDNYRNPIYSFGRGSNSSSGCSIMGGFLYKNVSAISRFPTKFHESVFFADYCNGWINYFPLSSPPTTGAPSSPANVFLTGLSAPVTLIESPDGSIYVTDRGSSEGGSTANTAVTTGSLYKITYTGNFAPVIYQDPQNVLATAGDSATFSVGVTGQAPLNFQWQKSGSNITGATGSSYTTPALTVGDSDANYSVLVWNVYPPAAQSNAATLTVSAGSRPTVTFSAPQNNSFYSAGETITYAASATDAADGDLPASRFSWLFVFHHQTHTHPFIGPITDTKTGTFTIGTSGEPDSVQWYRLHLYVTNSAGLTTSVFVDMFPWVVSVTLQTSQPGQLVMLDGQSYPAPYTFSAVVGMTRTIGAVLPLDNSLAFGSWSDGGALSHDIVVPSTNTTFTVTLNGSSPLPSPTTTSSPSTKLGVRTTAVSTMPAQTGPASTIELLHLSPLVFIAILMDFVF